MYEYYEIWEIEDEYRSLFDTIAEVARLCRLPYNTVLNAIGFNRNDEIRNLMLDPPTNYFSIEHLLCPVLNNFLREYNVPIRIVGKRKRYLGWWLHS